MSWLAGWSYRKQIAIAGTADGAQALYQMKLTIHRSVGADVGADVYVGNKCLANYNDIRITTSGGVALLDYWIESSDAASAVIWIEYDALLIAPNTTYFYLYFGNAGAAAYSNGDNTFPFFDHFDGDLSKWSGDTGLAAIAGSIMTFTSIDDIPKFLYGNTTVANNCRVRMKALMKNANYNGLGAGEAAINYNNFIFTQYNNAAPNQSMWRTSNAGAFTEISNSAIGFNAYHLFDMCRLLTGVDTARVFYDNIQVAGDIITNVGIVDYTAKFWAYANTNYVKADWVFLSNYTYTEPTWGTWGAEEGLKTLLLMGVGV